MFLGLKAPENADRRVSMEPGRSLSQLTLGSRGEQYQVIICRFSILEQLGRLVLGLLERQLEASS